jgi:hypothetical protein
MAPTCSICRNQVRDEINSALLGSGSLRDIAGRFGVAKSSLDRHRRKCLGPRIATALARYEEVDGKRLVADLLGLRERLAAGVLRTSASEDYGNLRSLSAELRQTVELIGRFTGDLEAAGGVRIDARRQVAVIASMSEDELRALARAALNNPAPDALGSPLVSHVVESSSRPVPRLSGPRAQPGARSASSSDEGVADRDDRYDPQSS